MLGKCLFYSKQKIRECTFKFFARGAQNLTSTVAVILLWVLPEATLRQGFRYTYFRGDLDKYLQAWEKCGRTEKGRWSVKGVLSYYHCGQCDLQLLGEL